MLVKCRLPNEDVAKMVGPRRTFPETLAWRARETPDRVFLETMDARTVTYLQLHEQGLSVAGALRQAGVERGERVVSLQDLHPEAFANWLGLSHLRAWDVPIHTGARGDALIYAVTHVDATTVLADSAYVSQLADVAGELKGLRRVIVTDDGPVPDLPFDVHRQSQLSDAEPVSGDDLPKPWDVATVVHSSGTTGPAKAIVVPWGSFTVQALRMWPMDDMDHDDVFYTYAPTYYTASKCYPEMMAILGGRCVLQPRLSVQTFWADVARHGVTTSIVYREQAEYLLDQPARSDDAQTSLKNVMMIPVSPRHQEFRDRFGVRVCTGYGLSEVGNITTSGGWDTKNWSSVGRVTAGTPDWEYRIVDSYDYDVAPGDVGELLVRAGEPWAMSTGYYRMPEKTAEAWRNGWFHTGDAVREEADGSIYWVDRFSDLLKRDGTAVASYELERYFLEHAGVADVAAVAAVDLPSPDAVRVFIVRTVGSSVSAEELMTHARQVMPKAFVPDDIRFIDALPRTQASNRIQKTQLRSRTPEG